MIKIKYNDDLKGTILNIKYFYSLYFQSNVADDTCAVLFVSDFECITFSPTLPCCAYTFSLKHALKLKNMYFSCFTFQICNVM